MSRSKKAPGHGHGDPEQLHLELGKFRKATPTIHGQHGNDSGTPAGADGLRYAGVRGSALVTNTQYKVMNMPMELKTETTVGGIADVEA